MTGGVESGGFAASLDVQRTGSTDAGLVFEGRCVEASPGRAFGGHLMALALRAACESVPAERGVCRLHARFVRPVTPARAVQFTVDAGSDSRSFSNRRITGRQDGKAAIECEALFAVPFPGPEYQPVMPLASPVEELVSEVADPVDVDVRHSEGDAVHRGALADPRRQRVWMRALPLPAVESAHVAALAYLSDLRLAWLALSANGIEVARRHSMATAEHTIRFHRSCRADEWLLYDQRCESTARGLAMCSGDLFARDGSLAASVTQLITLRLEKV